MLTAVSVFLRVETLEQSDNTSNRIFFLQIFCNSKYFAHNKHRILPAKPPVACCSPPFLFQLLSVVTLSGLVWTEKSEILIRVIAIAVLPPPPPLAGLFIF